MFKIGISMGLAWAVLALGLFMPISAQAQGEARKICEVTPQMKCLDKEKINGTTITVRAEDAAIARDGFVICDSSFNYTTAPDIVLIMDNTQSMGSVQKVGETHRWCDYPNDAKADPGCISGDPRSLRGPALQTFLDSALVKGGKGIHVGIVTFSDRAEKKSPNLLPLNDSTIEAIKASIVMKESGNTNYTEAFDSARTFFAKSKKPREEQFIIFISDGRPYLGEDDPRDPYAYKAYWDSLPTVHSIFLGENSNNYQAMQDISRRTKGEFFPISDVGLLAKILTDDLSKKLFRRARPTRTLIENSSLLNGFNVAATDHILTQDSSSYTLHMPGPLYLRTGKNEITVKTEYGYGGVSQDIQFSIERTATGPFTAASEACRAYPELVLFNFQNEPISTRALPYTINDSLVRYTLSTEAPGVDTIDVALKTFRLGASGYDLEVIEHSSSAKQNFIWPGTAPFKHQASQKKHGDHLVQTDHGEMLQVSYRHPYIPEDSAQVTVKIKYEPDFDRAAYWDKDGDGRIETVEFYFKEALANLPDQFKLHIVDAAGVGHSQMVRVSEGEIQYGKKSDQASDLAHVRVTLKNPFPFGVTSVANPDTSARTYKQFNIPMVGGTLRVDDSVPPVILAARVVKPEKNQILTQVRVTYSEPIRLDPTSALEPVVIKRRDILFSAKQIPVDHIEKISATQYTFYLADKAEFSPVGGDSIAINNNGETRDELGRGPEVKTFTPMGGSIPSQKISDFFVTFSNGSRSEPSGSPDSPNRDRVFIPVDKSGYALPGNGNGNGNGNGKCAMCIAKVGDYFTGSVFVLVTKYPVAYEFAIYTNLGQFVVRGAGKVEEADLPLLEKRQDPSLDPNLTEYTQRIVWTGQTQNGQMAGTGAYILKAIFRYEQSFKTGARPSMSTKFTKFGFLRDCCESVNDNWFD